MFAQVFEQLGPVGWPLALLSLISVALILERTVTFIMLPSLGRARVREMLSDLKTRSRPQRDDLCRQLCGQGHSLSQGVSIMLAHANSSKPLREEVAGLWLLNQRHKLQASLRFLMLIGVLSPMVGLLGTVLGMIGMFQALAQSVGPVTPAILADGLWAAMYTTAFGLIVAIPSIAASHLFSLWASHYMNRLEFVMNHVNLLIEGVDPSQVDLSANVVPLEQAA